MKDLKLFTSIKNGLGEGPYYYTKTKDISFVDIVNKKLVIVEKSGNIKEVLFPEKVSAAVPLENSVGYIVCGESHLYLYKNNEITEYKDISNLVKPGMRCNDAKADAYGRLFFSIMDDMGHNNIGALYLLDNGKIKLVEDNIKLGNGMAWNKASTKFYFIDSARHECYSYDYDLKAGAISNKKVLFKIDEIPDGMTIDNNDNLFVALWGSSRIEVRNSNTGDVIDIINIPTKLITSCTFIGDDFNNLLITTASLEEKDLYAGRVFKLKLDNYVGREENYF